MPIKIGVVSKGDIIVVFKFDESGHGKREEQSMRVFPS